MDVDTTGDGTADLLAATLLSIGLQVDGAGVHVDGLAHLTVSGQLSLATVTPAAAAAARYTALRMGAVTVSGTVNLGLDLTADLVVERLDVNLVAAGFDRLDWRLSMY